jgi:hypothetical protein
MANTMSTFVIPNSYGSGDSYDLTKKKRDIKTILNHKQILALKKKKRRADASQ